MSEADRRRGPCSRHIGHISGFALALVACGAQHASGPVGTSTGPAPRSVHATDAGVVGGDAGIPADYESSMQKVNRTRFTSMGHVAGRWDADVYANDLAKTPFEADSGEVPVGAKVLMVHFERTPGGGRGPLMMMEKRTKGMDPEHGDWRYVVVTSSGKIVQDGSIEGCAGCHDDAPHDHLFRVGE